MKVIGEYFRCAGAFHGYTCEPASCHEREDRPWQRVEVGGYSVDNRAKRRATQMAKAVWGDDVQIDWR